MIFTNWVLCNFEDRDGEEDFDTSRNENQRRVERGFIGHLPFEEGERGQIQPEE